MKNDLPPGRDVALLLSCRASTIRENVPWNKEGRWITILRTDRILTALLSSVSFFFNEDVK